jgi:poly-gamma-glutamate synthesis protein (capsule biosynthesis protein)
VLRRQLLTSLVPLLIAPLGRIQAQVAGSGGGDSTVKIFLCGDVMTGRGIDQILPRPSSPEIHEQWLQYAPEYIEIAERVSGPIPREVDHRYVWGDALGALEAAQPAARIINLETAVTTSDDYWPGKGIHYRMHPANTPVLTAAGIDCCVLANNHVLDWGYDGLEETLRALRKAGIATAGAGEDRAGAAAPAVIATGDGRRVLVFSMGHGSSGISASWSAGDRQAGVWRLAALSANGIEEVSAAVGRFKRPGDIAIASIHWGGNWGFELDPDMREFAHNLLDLSGIDLVHGHSSHHPLGIEVYKERLILYGCGDFINDYEGIRGHEDFRGDLRLMYLPEIEPASGRLTALRMPVFRSHRFRLRSAGDEDVAWLSDVLDEQSRPLGDTRIEGTKKGELLLRWG